MKKILYTLLLVPFLGLGQDWISGEGGNPFDGEYRSAQITANSGEFPYHKSKLVVNLFNNKTVNVYITDGGYFQSIDELEVLWSFDNEPNIIYSTRCSKSSDGETIFFEAILTSTPYKSYTKFDLIEKLKNSNNVSVRLKNAHGKNDVSYSLSGSTKAIGFVFENYDLPIKNEDAEIIETPKSSTTIALKDEIEPTFIIPKNVLHSFSAYTHINELDTIFAFGYPIIGEVKNKYMYFNNFKKFTQFTEDISILFSKEYDLNEEIVIIKEDEYQLTIYPSNEKVKSIKLKTKDGVINEIFRWSFIEIMKPKIDEFKSQYNQQNKKKDITTKEVEQDLTKDFFITEITYNNLVSQLTKENEISIKYRIKKSTESFIAQGKLKSIAHNRIEYYDNENLKIKAIYFRYIDSISIVPKAEPKN